MSQPLWERLFVAATGPIVTAILALLVINKVTSWAQARRDTAETREKLASDLTETANSLYLALQAFWRDARHIPLADRRTCSALTERCRDLAETYQAARAKGQVLEQRLKIYYADATPSKQWHQVTDLLTVRYFLLLEGDGDRRRNIRRINAGDSHSGLTVDQLNNPTLLLDTYRKALATTIASLWHYEVDRSGAHLAGQPTITTWHGAAS